MCVLAPPFEALDAHWKYSQSLQPLPAFRGGLFAKSPGDDFPERSPVIDTGRLEINERFLKWDSCILLGVSPAKQLYPLHQLMGFYDPSQQNLVDRF